MALSDIQTYILVKNLTARAKSHGIRVAMVNSSFVLFHDKERRSVYLESADALGAWLDGYEYALTHGREQGSQH